MATTFTDVSEGVRRTIAAYAQALDDGRTDDVVATFCADGVLDMPGMGVHEGHDALRAAFGGWKPRGAQRHLVVNTLVTAWDEREASAVSDIVFLAQGKEGWAVHLVGRYDDVFHHDGDAWLLHRRHATFQGA